MPTQKHLVLDDDVHEILKERKELTGSSIKEVGNSILRSSLESVLLIDTIRKILVDRGKVSEDEYNHAHEQACLKLQRGYSPAKAPVEKTGRETFVSGSWKIKSLFRRSDSVFQVLEAWARDARQLPMEAHHHDADEFLITLNGRTIITMSGTPYTLQPLNMLQIPAGCVHSSTPLDGNCHLISVITPAVPEYSCPET